jgi:hypothetical protein
VTKECLAAANFTLRNVPKSMDTVDDFWDVLLIVKVGQLKYKKLHA